MNLMIRELLFLLLLFLLLASSAIVVRVQALHVPVVASVHSPSRTTRVKRGIGERILISSTTSRRPAPTNHHYFTPAEFCHRIPSTNTPTIMPSPRRKSPRLQQAAAAAAAAALLRAASSSEAEEKSPGDVGPRKKKNPIPPAAGDDPSDLIPPPKRKKRSTTTTTTSIKVASAAAAATTKKKKAKKTTKTSAKNTIATNTTTTPTSGDAAADVVLSPPPRQPSYCLPRTVEQERLAEFHPRLQYVMGIDEAGRGPLAGPVVAAAVWTSVDIEGIVDSKKITKEEDRERLFEQLMALSSSSSSSSSSIPPNKIQWAVSIIDAQRIDEINILQATLEGMRMAATALINPEALLEIPIRSTPSVDHLGCYVVCSASTSMSSTIKPGVVPVAVDPEEVAATTTTTTTINNAYYALIDGNKVPKNMPCPSESMVKGDGKEFCIAAASILAKVTRDRLMHGYDVLYPDYNLKQHKGYPTAAHMQAVFQHGASPIHRRTFAPLKHMQFDDQGKIIPS